MKLRKAVLKNFRGFAHAEFDLMDPFSGAPLEVALLVGDNGSGKSAVLQAVVGVIEEVTRVSPSIYDGAKILARDLRDGADELSVYLQWEDGFGDGGRQILGCTVRRAGHHEMQISTEGDAAGWIRQHLSRVDGVVSPIGLAVLFDVYRSLPPEPVDGPSAQAVIENPCDGALAGSLRRGRTPFKRIQQLKQWIVNLDAWQARAVARRRPEAQPALATWERLHQALNTLLKPYTFEGVDDRFEVTFRAPSGALVSLESLSDGLRSVFVIIADLLLRLSLTTQHKENTLLQEAVCLIDELDAHLHPRWQEQIIPGLHALFPNVQFIATTHSPLLVGSVEPHNVFMLTEEP